MLEGLGARLAAANVTPEDAARLRTICAELLRAIRERRFQDATDIDFDLHTAIIALAHHRRLAEQHKLIMHQVRFHMVQSGFLPSDYDALIAEHEELIEAVIAGEAQRAETLARRHNEAEIRQLTASLQGADPSGADIEKV